MHNSDSFDNELGDDSPDTFMILNYIKYIAIIKHSSEVANLSLTSGDSKALTQTMKEECIFMESSRHNWLSD